MKILVLLVAALASVKAYAATFHLTIAGTQSTAPARGTLTLRTINDGTRAPIVATVSVPGSVSVDVKDGAYVAELQVRGFWLAPQIVTVRTDSVIELAARRTGTIVGTIRGTGPPISVRFTDTADSRLAGEAVCGTEDTSFRCDLPAGTYDLRIGREAHVPAYRWNVPVTAGRTESLGSFELARGASVSGRLDIEDGSLDDVRLSLAPTAGTGTTLSIKPGENGFFSAGPVPAGEYTLTVAQKEFISTPVPLSVRDGFEASLREPLVLAKPRRLSVLISPPADPIALGWAVTLRQIGPKGTNPRVVAEGDASLDGSWSAENLLPGSYELIVRPKGGPVWRVETVVVADALTTSQLFIPSTRFEGTVRLGDQPLAARLIFGGSHTETAIPWRSDAQGRFQGYMPLTREKQWIVTVTSDVPPVDVTLRGVTVHVNESTGVARIDIALPEGTLQGMVVDERDQPVQYALVNVNPQTSAGRMTQIKSDEKGSFRVNGIAAGRYRVTASDYLKESDAVEIELAEDAEEPPSIRLQVKPYRQWKGRIVTLTGQPVAGARIVAAAADVAINVAYPARSDADGRFVLLVPAVAKLFDFIVAPRGFTYNFFRRSFAEDLSIVVHPAGGTLLLELPDDPSVEAAVWHNGSVTSAHALVSGWLGERQQSNMAGTMRLRIPNLDPGSYTLCLVASGTVAAMKQPGPDCQSTYLAPHGESAVMLSRSTAR